MVRRATALLLILSGPLFGADAPQIVGETKVAPYKMIRLKVENLPEKAIPTWEVKPTSTANVGKVDWLHKSFQVKEPIWVAPPGNYVVRAMWGTVNTDGIVLIDYKETLVTIVSPSPTPPDPGPDPEPTPPDPTPSPAPIPVEGLRVMIVDEAMNRESLTAGQREVVFGAVVRDFLRTSTVINAQNPDGSFRIWDQHQNPAGDPDAGIWGPALTKVNAVQGNLPKYLVSNGKTGVIAVLPPDITGQKFIDIVKQYQR